jgi:hypothetical protein
MSSPISPEADKALADIAARHGLSLEAVRAMLYALQAGGGTMAQFDIPELGGSGQWMRGGMTMVGNMFDNAVKARVDALCAELAQLLATTMVFPARSTAPTGPGGWWPADLGVPSAAGGQNDARYAVFPGTRRLAIHSDGVTRVFDTGDHQIGGVQQQQGGRRGSMTFTSQLGTFDVASLTELGAQPAAEPTAAAPAQAPAAQAAPAQAAGDTAAIIGAIEALAELHGRGILSDGEFAAKKTELLGRL